MGKCRPAIVAKPSGNDGVSSNRALDGKGGWGRGPSSSSLTLKKLAGSEGKGTWLMCKSYLDTLASSIFMIFKWRGLIIAHALGFISYNNAFRCRVAAECHWTESFVEFSDSQSIGEVVLLNGFNTPVNVGVVLDFDTGFGKKGLTCINMSLSDFYASHSYYNTRLVLHKRNSPSDVVVTASAEVDARIPYRSTISPKATDDQIAAELYKLKGMQTQVFIVHMLPSLGSRLFDKANQIGMMEEGYAWIMTDGITNSFIEKVGAKNFSLQKMNRTSGNSSTTALEGFGISQNGPQLVQALLATSFKGLSGDFSLLNGQLQSSTFQIVNVFGHGEKLVGYWTPQNGLERKLNSTKTGRYSTSDVSLGSIIWPGDTTSAPKGWQIPTSDTRLKILVPVQDGFSTFVTVTYDPRTSTSSVNGGYCINVFEAVIKSLPYAVPYELYPYAKPNGEAAGSYNDLVNQVFLGNYDAAVGDTTIRANRSLYVDFTLPYTESGVFMVVPIKDNKSKKAWVFLKPLTWELWVTSGCSFIFIGFVVWILEHRINKDFRGPPDHQVGTIFWFTFSTMVFAHRERVVSNLARFVVILWCFVVLILTQSYTASLTSLLTVQQLQPTVTDVNLLIKNRNNVAYQRGSFVYGILKQLGFQDENLKTFNSAEELNQLFHNASRKYGISAAFDETPYMKLFLARYCSKYTMIPPTFKADGFGFVFPKGSPLARDVSRAILNVSEGEKMKDIERIWFKKEASCADPNSLVSSSSLSLDSFWGLFLIAGVASAFVLLIFAAMFLHAERQEILQQLRRLVPGASLWTRICVVLRIYDQWDLRSYTFQNNGLEAPAVEAPIGAPAEAPATDPPGGPAADAPAAGAPGGAPIGAPLGQPAGDIELISDHEIIRLPEQESN
ncbi:unnamed protein product [Prunus brigantina]